MKKLLCISIAVLSALSAGSVLASRTYAISYMYFDDQGYTVGEGYIPCSGAMIIEGQKTNNFVEISRESCGQSLPAPWGIYP